MIGIPVLVVTVEGIGMAAVLGEEKGISGSDRIIPGAVDVIPAAAEFHPVPGMSHFHGADEFTLNSELIAEIQIGKRITLTYAALFYQSVISIVFAVGKIVVVAQNNRIMEIQRFLLVTPSGFYTGKNLV